MKRLLGLLLVMGIVGCGENENAGNAVDPVAALEKLGAKIYRTVGPEIDAVDLNDTQITDGGLVHLKGMTKLQVLALKRTKVTDAGLVHLKGLTSLKTVDVAETQVTDAGVAELQKALPDCIIITVSISIDDL